MIPTYAQLVLDKFEGVRSSGEGNQFTACCPAHDDSKQSLGIGVSGDRVLLRCYAGCTAEMVVNAVGLKLADLFDGNSRIKPVAGALPDGVTVRRLAFEKRIPESWLRNYCGVEDVKGYQTIHTVEIPYRDEAGKEIFRRIRSALKAKDGTAYKRKGTPPALYGLWLLPEFRARGGPIILVEGETDCWALWSHGFNALGVPGSTNLKVLDGNLAVFDGFPEIFLWREHDAPAAKFANEAGSKLRALGVTVPIRVAYSEAAKDPSDIQARYAAEFRSAFEPILAAATPWAPIAIHAPAALAPLPKVIVRNEAALRAIGVCPWADHEMTDLGNAGRLESLHGKDVRYVATWDRWLIWDSKRWVPDETLEIYRRATQTVEQLALEAQGAGGKSGFDECMKFFEKSQSSRGLDATIKISRATGQIPTSHRQFDKQNWLFNTENGTIDLKSGELRDYDREQLLTAISPVEYDPDAKCPAWESALSLIFPKDLKDPTRGGDPEMIAYVQRLMGYCMTGVIHGNMLPIFWGDGGNGKGVFLDTVRDVMGSNYSLVAPDKFMMQKHGETHPTELADLYGKRFVVASESNKNQKFDEALLKRLTGGDDISARRMGENFWSFSPTHKIILCTNHLPRVQNNDRGIWRRLLLVPFLVEFWDSDDPKAKRGHVMRRQDKAMKDKLRNESQGILAWLVRGCLAWQKEGLERPDVVARMTSEYRQGEDVLGRFLDDRYREAQDGEVELKAIHQDFVKWCEGNGEKAWGSRQLATDLRSKGYECRPGTGNRTTVFGLESLEPAAFNGDDLGD